jgi:DNA ligase-1
MWQVYVTLPAHATACLTAKDVDLLVSSPSSSPWNNNLPAKYYTKYGKNMLKTTSEMTTIYVGKNIGKSNETSPLTQAMSVCSSMFRLKMTKGFTPAAPPLGLEDTPAAVAAAPQRVYPMALQPFSHISKIKFPCYVQPKLDGIRCLASYTGTSVSLTSRGGLAIDGFESIKQELSLVFQKLATMGHQHDHIYIDGELYLHGVPLQVISGVVRRSATSASALVHAQAPHGGVTKEALEFHVFDCFTTLPTSETVEAWTCEERVLLLSEVFNSIHSPSAADSHTKLRLVETTRVESMEHSDSIFDALTSLPSGDTTALAAYEGIVYKNMLAAYEFSTTREKRSMNYIKRKVQHTSEFPIVSFTHGKGKYTDCVVFELAAGVETFSVVPLGSTEYRSELYRLCVEDFSRFEGKLATVKYDDLSSAGVPLRGQIVQIDRID